MTWKYTLEWQTLYEDISIFWFHEQIKYISDEREENGDEISPDGLNFLCLFHGFGSSRNGSLNNCRPKRWRFAGLSLSWGLSSDGYFCNSFNLLQLVTKPTRTTNSSKTLIDVALTTEFYHQLRCKYLGSCWSLFGGGHTKAKSPKASAFLYFYQNLQNLQSWVISEYIPFGVHSFLHCKYFGRF